VFEAWPLLLKNFVYFVSGLGFGWRITSLKA